MISDKDSRYFRPKNLVHLCFAVVFVFSSILTVREAMILKSAYETRQRAWLVQAAGSLERQWQQSIDQMFFFQKMLQHALIYPLETDKAREALNMFNDQRHDPLWKISVNTEWSIPLYGISDEAVRRVPLLNRGDSQRLDDELKAALEMSYILQFANPHQDFHSRLWYISRAGFYLSSVPDDNEETVTSYNTVIDRPYFTRARPELNPERILRWSETYLSVDNEGDMVTVTLPVDAKNYWFGVLAMDFSTRAIHQYLQHALPKWQDVSVMLFDNQQHPVAISEANHLSEHHLDKAQIAEIFRQVTPAQSGQLKSGLNFITWVRLQNFDGLLISVQPLREGMSSETGRVTLVLILMWGVFSVVLIASHQAIIRMTGRLLTLQETLSWRANYDGLTLLLNRSAFFEHAEKLSVFSERQQQPVSLIQLDLDHFKSVNDSLGHHAGDIVLTHSAAVIAKAMRKRDILGRVGGEEFCIVLPDTGLAEAVEIAERIRCKLASKEVLIDAMHTIKVTASMGVSSSEEQGDYQIESLQSVADGRLYLAKAAGRNCVSSGT
ncbi:cellulose biosynthesis regulator diguanylate cyclase DgcQ [Erwinia persicina]|uniref:cellulose biosynthesis regulator diguanylate cyclase DgcQ n=1 Tax=Erwinia persicina TaxID=55211 RepID=UPI001386BC4B|nr:cellulose biosynthesis regulator diguanylate cyclase DgcQ [Erwinia persicina]